MDAREATRRASRTDDLEQLFRSQPLTWIPARELAHVAGFCAWRTRVADVRRRVKDAGDGDIAWNGEVKDSMYRFVPWPSLGRNPSTPVPRTLFRMD